MNQLTTLITSSQLLMWVIPIGIVALTTAVGWLAERLTIRWLTRLMGRGDSLRELAITRTLRGHITFWGLLLGLSLSLSIIYAKNSPYAPPPTSTQAGWYLTVEAWYPKALTALFILSLTFLLARLAVTLIHVSATGAARPVVSLISNVAWFITRVIGFLLVLATLQINITPGLTALGVAGLAVSLALQATLTDLISGMLLLGTRQLEVGNYIKLSSGEEGYITDINWRTTTIRQLGDNQIIVPNSKMTQSSVTNFHTPQPNTSVSVPVGVSYGSELERVERVTLEVAREVMRSVKGGVTDFEPLIRYQNLGEYSIQFTIILQGQEYTDQYLIKSEFIKRLYTRYRLEDIRFPFPIQSVRLSEASLRDGAAAPATPTSAGGVASAGKRSRSRAQSHGLD